MPPLMSIEKGSAPVIEDGTGKRKRKEEVTAAASPPTKKAKQAGTPGVMVDGKAREVKSLNGKRYIGKLLFLPFDLFQMGNCSIK